MSFFNEIKDKINKKINPENIILIDNSHSHVNHKSFKPNKYILNSNKVKKFLYSYYA